LPIDRQVSRRYERGSIIITSNQSLGAWGEVFGDTVIASVILDRLLHHFDHGQYQRLKLPIQGKLKAGLLRPKLETPLTA
jgi:DNA replication protein DnaC